VHTEETQEVPKDVLIKRLTRVEGQVRGIQKMISEDRDCVSIVTQLAAVRSGIEGIGALVLNNCMKRCFYNGPDDKANMEILARAVSIWGRVRGGENT
jgi:CsoR family transcriptional regulator, copper-sensing transcriptional repressor